MKKTSPAVRLAWGIGYGLAGIGFFFSIIGVFGPIAAVGSLLVFILIAIISIFQTASAES